MSSTNILVIDNHWVVIEGIKSAIQKNQNFKVIGETIDGRQAVQLSKSLKPDIVVMDISMSNLNGLRTISKIKKFNPKVRFIIFTMHTNKHIVIDLFKSGISGYVLKNDSLSDLVLALNAVRGGGTYFNSMATEILFNHVKVLEVRSIREEPYERLSKREREVFQYLANGKSIKKISTELQISPKTVESHKYNIMDKLKVNSSIDLTKFAIRENLINV